MNQKHFLEDYVQVHERITQFHKKFAKNDRAIITNLVAPEVFGKQGGAVVRTEVCVDGKVRGTGLSTVIDLEEKKALEKAETVSIGRALAVVGFEIKHSLASMEEMAEVPAPVATTTTIPTSSLGKATKKTTEPLKETPKTISTTDYSANASGLSSKTEELLAKYGKAKGSSNSTTEIRR